MCLHAVVHGENFTFLPDHILSKMSPVHVFTCWLYKFHINVILLCTSRFSCPHVSGPNFCIHVSSSTHFSVRLFNVSLQPKLTKWDASSTEKTRCSLNSVRHIYIVLLILRPRKEVPWIVSLELLRFPLHFFFHGAITPSGPSPLHCWRFMITLRHTTVGRIPLDEWQYTTFTRHPCPRGIRTRNPTKRAAQTHALDRVATGIGFPLHSTSKYFPYVICSFCWHATTLAIDSHFVLVDRRLAGFRRTKHCLHPHHPWNIFPWPQCGPVRRWQCVIPHHVILVAVSAFPSMS
jgi:hypothetical protein